MQEFTEVFRAEHRDVRDLLLDLVDAFEDGDVERARALVRAVDAATGPHVRYEEEAMYPQLAGIFGATYVDALLAANDAVIRDVQGLYALARHDVLDPGRRARGMRLARRVLCHLSGCDGLSIMVETLPDERVAGILAARRSARAAGLRLLGWAATSRRRTA